MTYYLVDDVDVQLHQAKYQPMNGWITSFHGSSPCEVPFATTKIIKGLRI